MSYTIKDVENWDYLDSSRQKEVADELYSIANERYRELVPFAEKNKVLPYELPCFSFARETKVVEEFSGYYKRIVENAYYFIINETSTVDGLKNWAERVVDDFVDYANRYFDLRGVVYEVKYNKRATSWVLQAALALYEIVKAQRSYLGIDLVSEPDLLTAIKAYQRIVRESIESGMPINHHINVIIPNFSFVSKFTEEEIKEGYWYCPRINDFDTPEKYGEHFALSRKKYAKFLYDYANERLMKLNSFLDETGIDYKAVPALSFPNPRPFHKLFEDPSVQEYQNAYYFVTQPTSSPYGLMRYMGTKCSEFIRECVLKHKECEYLGIGLEQMSFAEFGNMCIYIDVLKEKDSIDNIDFFSGETFYECLENRIKQLN